MKPQILSLRGPWKYVHGCLALWAGLAVAQPLDLEKMSKEREAEHVANFWIGCETAKCHPSVGSLFRVNVKFEVKNVKGGQKISGLSDVGRCTQSLVGPNRILTNAHCIPDGAKLGDSILNTYAIFPATTATSDKTGLVRAIERVKVKKVLSVSDFDRKSKLSTDFAILELEREIVGRPILPIVQRDFQDGQKYRVIAMWPLKDYSNHPDPKLKKNTPVGALQRYESCRALMNTVILSYFSSGSGAYFTLFGCPVPEGNSGSPIFNDQDEIVGVLSSGPRTQVEVATTGQVAKYSMSETYENHLADLSQPEATPRFWLSGTTAKCILHPELCQNERIYEAQENAAAEVVKEIYEREMNARIQAVIAQVNAGPAGGSAFVDTYGDVSTGSFPKLQVELRTELLCPSFDYFKNLHKTLGIAPGQSFEAKVSYRTRTWLINAGIGPDWKYEFSTKSAPDSERDLLVRVTPQEGKPATVSEILPNGTTRALGELCSRD